MPHDLAEPLFKPFAQHSCARTPRARPSATRGLLKLQNPSHRIMHAGTIEISRLTHPPTSDLYRRFSCKGAFWGLPGAFAVPSPLQSAGAARALKMAQKGSKMLKKAQRGSKRRSKRLFEPARCRQCARRGCSSLLRRRQCVRKGCSSLLFKITIRKCWTRLHCALRLFAQLSLLRAWICTGPH